MPLAADRRGVAEPVVVHLQRRQGKRGAIQVLVPDHRDAAVGGNSALVELLVERARVELEFGARAAEQRDARGHRARHRAAGAEVQEAGAAFYARLRQLHRAERRHRDDRVADAAVDVGVIAAADLHVAGRRGGVARLLRADRVHEALDRRLHRGRRVLPQDGLELLARAHQLAEHEIAARQLQPGAVVVGKAHDVALERQHALAGVAAVERGDAVIEIEIRLAELLGVAAAESVGVRRAALLEQRAQLVRGRGKAFAAGKKEDGGHRRQARSSHRNSVFPPEAPASMHEPAG